MLNQIKIICAETTELKRRRKDADKKINSEVDSLISMTARAVIPDANELLELQSDLMKESETVKEILQKIDELKELAVKQEMTQMVMNFKEE